MTSHVEIMINARYGGFGISKEGMEEYHKRCPGTDEIDYYDIARHDPVMIQIIKEMGAQVNDTYSHIKLKKIPSQYVRHYSIHEYDGMESVTIDYNTYKIDMSKEILRDQNLSKSDKLTRISAILNADLREV